MYRRILDFWTAERESQELQRLPDGFIHEVNRYLEELAGGAEGVRGRLMQEELNRAKTALAELRLLRKSKICRDFLSGTLDPERLLEDEKGFFKEKAPEQAPAWGTKKILARLLGDVPPFIGVDLKTYGPYKTEDVALLPAQNAEALIKRGIAAEIKR